MSTYHIDLDASKDDGRLIRIAAFASNPRIYGLNRMFQGLADGTERVSVFNDRARARAWLIEG